MPRLAKPIEFFYNENNEDYASTGNHYRSDIISNSNDPDSNDTNSNDTNSNDTNSNDTNSNDTNSNELTSFNNVLLILLNSIIKIFNGRKLNRNEYIYLGVFIIIFSSIMYLIYVSNHH
jgi:hypothetical protein